MADLDSPDKAPVGHFESSQAQPAPSHNTSGFKSIMQYLKTRVPTLKPPMRKAPNPVKALTLLNRQQWLFFSVAFLGWTLDALDFFTVSLTTSELAAEFDKEISDITWGITLVLMLRSVGAITFGIASDRWGRKWPFVINNLLFIALEIGTGFTQTYQQFLAVRALFGIAMGGLYGNVAATALEDCPKEARGIISGLLQQGYAFGYLLATAFARALVGTTSHGWRPFYWFAGCLPVLAIAFRLCLPETNAYRERQALRAEMPGNVTSTFISEGKVALKRHWLLLVYLVLLMAGFNFMSHGSQDLYPTLIERQFGFSRNAVTVTQVVANLGALTGGTICGWASQIFGRRFSIIIISIVGGALLYPYTFVSNKRIMAAAFFEQFCVQGAWGVIPIHLMELSPGSIRTFTVGTAYQLGNLVSSASSTIESTIGERFPLEPTEGGQERYDYGKVICIFMGCVFAYTILVTFFGPERLGRDFDVENDEDVGEVRAERGGDVEKV
ncbi:sugar transporter family protein [Aspergillus stella-maris]|uniref:sugar transporter family protein n=1 Tax=Aspergillus stella-maris TaxID=1810926 RepID=UPI003CCE0352